MPSKGSLNDLLEEAAEMIAACAKIDPNLTAGEITPAMLSATLAQIQGSQGRIIVLEQGLLDERNQRNAYQQQMRDMMKRLRAAVKSRYGDDSTEYELAGGTRMSSRKRPTRKAQA